MIGDGVSTISFLAPDAELSREDFESLIWPEDIEGKGRISELAFAYAVAAEFRIG